MTRQLCRYCSYPTDSARDITHYRTCVRKRDWPLWVVNRGQKVTAVAEATPPLGGGEPTTYPVLDPLPEDAPDPTPVAVPTGATLAFGMADGKAYEGLLCECGWMTAAGKEPVMALRTHKRMARVHKEAAVA